MTDGAEDGVKEALTNPGAVSGDRRIHRHRSIRRKPPDFDCFTVSQRGLAIGYPPALGAGPSRPGGGRGRLVAPPGWPGSTLWSLRGHFGTFAQREKYRGPCDRN